MSDAPIDLRGLDPPEPLLRVIGALGGAGPLRFLLSREPLPLYRILAREGWSYRVSRGEEGVELIVERPKGAPARPG